MSVFGKILGISTAIGAGIAITKIAEKVKEQNPDGIKDYNEDGKVDYKDYATAISDATREVATYASDIVKEKVEDIKANPDKYKDEIKEKADTVKVKATDAYNSVKDKISDIKTNINTTKETDTSTE